MKKLIPLVAIMLMLILLGISNIAEARKGQTSSEYDATTSSTSDAESKSSKSSSSLANAAKTKKAKSAWQNYLKKNEPASSLLKKDSQNLDAQMAELKSKLKTEKKRKKADKLAKQLAAIEKQIADAKRQQQLIAIAQTAAQALMNKSRQPTVNRLPRTTQALPVTPQPPKAVSLNTAKTAPARAGMPWGWIFLLIAGIVVVIVWRKNSNNAPITNYRL
jgi:conjugal transfer/entry exclusion protein